MKASGWKAESIHVAAAPMANADLETAGRDEYLHCQHDERRHDTFVVLANGS